MVSLWEIVNDPTTCQVTFSEQSNNLSAPKAKTSFVTNLTDIELQKNITGN